MSTLLFTVSRCLVDTDEARHWTRQQVLRELAMLELGSCVITGRSGFGDKTAEELAVAAKFMFRGYDLDGMTYDGAGRSVVEWTLQAPPKRHASAAQWKAWCLERNRVMVDNLRVTHFNMTEQLPDGTRVRSPRFDCRVVGIKAPWSKTDGTGFTVAEAQRVNLPNVMHVCPVEFAPRGKQ